MSDAWIAEEDAWRFWRTALSESGSFTSWVHYRTPFFDEICTIDDLGAALAFMASDTSRNTDASLQVFLEGVRPPVLEARVLANPPPIGQSFERWLRETFGESEFCIVQIMSSDGVVVWRRPSRTLLVVYSDSCLGQRRRWRLALLLVIANSHHSACITMERGFILLIFTWGHPESGCLSGSRRHLSAQQARRDRSLNLPQS
jgi:hypothetical protein